MKLPYPFKGYEQSEIINFAKRTCLSPPSPVFHIQLAIPGVGRRKNWETFTICCILHNWSVYYHKLKRVKWKVWTGPKAWQQVDLGDLYWVKILNEMTLWLPEVIFMCLVNLGWQRCLSPSPAQLNAEWLLWVCHWCIVFAIDWLKISSSASTKEEELGHMNFDPTALYT